MKTAVLWHFTRRKKRLLLPWLNYTCVFHQIWYDCIKYVWKFDEEVFRENFSLPFAVERFDWPTVVIFQIFFSPDSLLKRVKTIFTKTHLLRSKCTSFEQNSRLWTATYQNITWWENFARTHALSCFGAIWLADRRDFPDISWLALKSSPEKRPLLCDCAYSLDFCEI